MESPILIEPHTREGRMNILETILNAKNGAALEQLSTQFGLRPDQASSAVAALVPALAAGFQRNMSNESGLEGLVGALTRGQHQQYLDNPDVLADAATTMDGNKILGHVFGSKDVSRQVAASAAQRTGMDASVLKKMLPVVAALAMAGLSRQTKATGATNPAAARAGLGGMLGSLLDKQGDGSIVDDVVGMLGGVFGRKA
jgi:hypothetical protein